MATYEICGTCSVHCEGNTTKVRLFPAPGYLSPNRKWAYFFPLEVKLDTNALLRETTNGFCEVTSQDNEQLILSAVAAHDKIQLFLNEHMVVSGVRFP